MSFVVRGNKAVEDPGISERVGGGTVEFFFGGWGLGVVLISKISKKKNPNKSSWEGAPSALVLDPPF